MKKMKIAMILISLLVLTATASAKSTSYTFITIDDYLQSANRGVLLDVRSAGSRMKSNQEVPGSVWIDPHRVKPLKDFVAVRDQRATYVIFCSCVDDKYSVNAAELLVGHGFSNIKVLKGGWDEIQRSGMLLIEIEQGNS